MNPPDDLKRQFAALRDEDTGDAPSFAGTLAAARARQERRGSANWAWAALVGTAVIATIAVMLNLVGPRESPSGESGSPAGTVEQWIAPTGDLLASAELLAEPGDMFVELAFFSSPTADLIDLGDELTTRTP